MVRALELACRPATTSPNPRVGCVVVRDGVIVGEGYHEGSGTPHAETVALTGIDAAGATIYVTLEPCMHEGRTPPCTPMVIAAAPRRVVIAMTDPDRRTDGSGVDALRAAGIEVEVGVMEQEARRVNAPYIHHRSTGRSFVSLKLALSLDGRIGAADGSSAWITSEETRRTVHARRLEADAILVGSGTVIADDPALTVRLVDAPRQPLRVVVDASGRVPAGARLFGEPGEVLMVTTEGCPHDVQMSWKEAGAEVAIVPSDPNGVDLQALLGELGRRDIVEVYCEGGARLSTSLLDRDLVDRLELHYGPILIGGSGPSVGDIGVGSMSEAKRFRTIDVVRTGDDISIFLERT